MSTPRVFAAAMDALRNRAPFALIRLGDGEGRMLMWPTRICREMLDRHLKFWFGRSDFTDAQVSNVRNELILAIKDADAIGCYRGDGRNKYWQYPAKFLDNRDLAAGKIETCNAAHRQLWTTGALDMLIGRAEGIGLVSCRDVLDQFASRYKEMPMFITVPGEARSCGQRTDHMQKFTSYRNHISGVVSPGDLWLVGAGVLGKVYCADIKRAGGVALDIGSVFDGWAGVKSRSYLSGDNFRLRDKEA
jgi:hypothetical protein